LKFRKNPTFSIIVFLTLTPLTHCWFIIPFPPFFGPDTPEAIFKGRILEYGRPVPAQLSLEVLYRMNGEEVPLSLMQVVNLKRIVQSVREKGYKN
jgi:hypothetical protein